MKLSSEMQAWLDAHTGQDLIRVSVAFAEHFGLDQRAANNLLICWSLYPEKGDEKS